MYLCGVLVWNNSMIELQHDSAPLSILLDVMNAAGASDDLYSYAEQALDRLLMDPAFASGGIWLAEQGRVSCLAQRGLDRSAAEALIARALEPGAPQFVERASQTIAGSPAGLL